MIVAEVQLVTAPTFAATSVTHHVPFSDLAAADAEYKRVAALLTARGGKGNGGTMLESVGDAGYKITVPLDSLHSVSLHDYALDNDQRAGMKDAFPRLFEKL